MKRGDPVLAQRAETINKYLDTMVRTMSVDPTVPSGITPTIARKAAFLGEPLDKAAKAAGKVDPFEQRLKDLERQAMGLNSQTIENSADDRNRARYEPIAHRFADRYGVPREVASFLFGQEAGWNPAIGQTRIDNNGDGKPDSTAKGIGQFIESTAKQYGLIDEQGNDFRGDANKSMEAAMKLLSDNYRKTGSWEKALAAYGVTDRRNFKTEEAYNSVIERARRAIQGDD
jgi:soluble lytic murein transglycosylase-like protein